MNAAATGNATRERMVLPSGQAQARRKRHDPSAGFYGMTCHSWVSTFICLSSGWRQSEFAKNGHLMLEHFSRDRVTVLQGHPQVLNACHYHLVIEALERSAKPVVFLDGGHCFNGFDFGERNFQRGNAGDYGADRVLTCRAMTPFQWAKMLTTELHDHLRQYEPSLVVAAHYDVQFNKDDLVDWEQLDYVASCTRFLRRLAHHHQTPIILTLDLARWTRTHPSAAQLLAGLPRRHVTWDARGGTLHDEAGRILLQPDARHTLDAWLNPELEGALIV